MSKIIWICSKDAFDNQTQFKISEICDNLTPDNIIPNKPRIKVSSHIAYGVLNPKHTITYSENSVALGKIYDDSKCWHEPNSEFPDGSYAIFRDSQTYCEVVSDPCSSRTIWYYSDDNLLITSTSQRAIILYLGNFHFNEKVIPWMLSTGSLGPKSSWDKRIKQIPPQSSIILDKKSWSLTENFVSIKFKEKEKTRKEHEIGLKKAINNTFKSMQLCKNSWVLPLSGGYDSRAILCLLKSQNDKPDNLKTITWGLESSINQKHNDASVAKQVARSLKVQHKYYNTDLSDEPIENIFNRFLINGEGRIDHISGYMDGFHIWKILHEEGIQGIIRGDEGFGWSKVASPLDVRLVNGIGLCSDFRNFTKSNSETHYSQEIPKILQQNPNETNEFWRDRLYHQYRLPIVLAALNDLKLSYVEQINPLLSQQILNQVRQLPDKLRTDKFLFKKLVDKLSPNIPYARCGANAKPSVILKSETVKKLLVDVLNSPSAKELFAEKFLSAITSNLKSIQPEKNLSKRKFSIKAFVSSLMPASLKKFLKNRVPIYYNIDQQILAFRIYIIVKMYELLSFKKFSYNKNISEVNNIRI